MPPLLQLLSSLGLTPVLHGDHSELLCLLGSMYGIVLGQHGKQQGAEGLSTVICGGAVNLSYQRWSNVPFLHVTLKPNISAYCPLAPPPLRFKGTGSTKATLQLLRSSATGPSITQ